ncbi:hypothetical protein, partial [Polaromonas sp.]|uniref:hypothetical protein n=1 Tax=Polaromonas sp. TaxID=1869339 RepID=UPI0025FACF82
TRSRFPGQLSLVTFFFARKESYPPPGRRSPLNPQKNPPKAPKQKTQRSNRKRQQLQISNQTACFRNTGEHKQLFI